MSTQPGRDDASLGLDGAQRRPGGVRPDGDDVLAVDGDVGATRRRAGSVHDQPIADHEIDHDVPLRSSQPALLLGVQRPGPGEAELASESFAGGYALGDVDRGGLRGAFQRRGPAGDHRPPPAAT